MIAKPTQKSSEDYNAEATQWFIVSDLGLTAFSGDDGVHAFVRSLADGDAYRRRQGQADRPQQRGARAPRSPTPAAMPSSTPRLARGEGGLRRRCSSPRATGGEYAFLDLTSSAFDLTDRGVKGREAPGPLDGFLYTERGVYRPGEDVHLAAIVRDKAGKAASLPVTVIVTRPDGVEHRRFTLNDQPASAAAS